MRARHLVAAALLVAAPRAARAQDVEAAFRQGVAHADARRWAEAADAFEAARAVSPLPAVLFNLAQAREQLGQRARALAAWREYLARASATASLRPQAEARVAALAPVVPTLRVEVTPHDARVTVDDVGVAHGEEVPLEPGPHAVAVRAAGHEPDARTLTLREGERAALVVRLPRLVAASVDPAPPPPPPPPPPPTSPPPAQPPQPAPATEGPYENAFLVAASFQMVPDDNGLGFGVGFRAGMRLGRTWEPQVGLSRITTNGVTYTVGGIGFYYVAQVASRFAFYMGPQAAVLVPECSRGCNYASSGTAAQTDLGLLVSLGARVEFMRWFAMLLEGNAGVARLTEPFPVLYLGAGAMVALGL